MPDPPRRRDGDLILSGRGDYLDDVRVPGLTYAAFARSPHPHARVRGFRTAAAEACPGVLRVLTGKEAAELIGPIPHFVSPANIGGKSAEFECLASEEVHYVGQPVAAVVATDPGDAEAAAELIEVDYDVLPAALHARQALTPGSARVFSQWEDNLVVRVAFTEGDVAGAFESAPHVLRDRVKIQRYGTSPLEPRGYIAQWNPDGRLVIRAATQMPHPLRSALAAMFDLPETAVRVIAPRLGGAFGHKFHGFPEEGVVCLLSRLVRAPVKWLERREDAMLVGAREMEHDLSIAFDGDGVILGLRDSIVCDVGALGTSAGWGMAFVAAMTFPGPYRVPAYEVESLVVVTNKAPWNGARGYGKESACLALERAVDLVAAELSLDPAEVRRRNFIPSTAFPYWTASKRLDSGDYETVLDKALTLSDYPELVEGRRQARAAGRLAGVGIAFELTPEGGDFPGGLARGFDTSTVRMDPSGSVTVLTGVTSPGTGNETAIAQLVAAELGVSFDRVRVVQGDTDTTPYGFGNGSSRPLNLGGGAAVLAAREIREKLVAAAAVALECDPASISLDQDTAVSDSGAKMPISDLARFVYTTSIAHPGVPYQHLEATRSYAPEQNLLHQPDSAGRTSSYPTFSNSAHVCAVEVDEYTGQVTLASYAAVDDCGVIVNPVLVRGQLLGAIAMGIGGALWEEARYDDRGHPVATSFKNYLVPRSVDLPPIRLGHHTTPSPFTLLGTKGAGEGGVAGAVAAVCNAVNDAIAPLGARVSEMPLSGPNVLRAIREATR
ncbi:xanthine dehydrogenase family protein molybdopterin-binding subunit [Amycolatopsis thermalba]|uniref:Xanthine dehydrogenase family protein molybdopterin-binding subunit n=1 Tax=Amycolatopsis thermalba TaxID=944492 RepID=A0ABY4P0W9_9PSEU|nr:MULTISPECIES: xanthine dehydrogenase family protein molybdopterin-binding subunit [Amycolatopsis]UQS25977.1 xanthine dehydrogenase family protein molybdopterin-binding subunit [Amycolatopsis thermalba]